MVKFLAHNGEGRRVVGLGLSRANCTALLAGMPIRVKLDEPIPAGLGLTDVPLDIVLVAGETELAIAQDVRAAMVKDADE